LLLDEEGRVWACGSGGLGQLGLRVARTRLEPARLAAFPDVREADRLELERRTGAVAVSGVGTVAVPRRSQVIDISCGQNHSIAVSADGTLWGWGHSEYAQMGAAPTMSSGETIMRSIYFYVPRPLGVT